MSSLYSSARLRAALLLAMASSSAASTGFAQDGSPQPEALPGIEAVDVSTNDAFSFSPAAFEASTSSMDASGDSCPTCDLPPLDWSKLPATVRPMPRPGNFPIPPAQGPAYFSLWDELTDVKRPAPPKSGYVPFALNAWSFADADWRFVDGIAPEDRTLVESLKRIQFGDSWLFSTGGEFWLKYHNEHNSRLTQANNDFTLAHVRLFGDLTYRDIVRVYGEYIWADSFSPDLPPLATDIDRGDIQQLFVDLKMFDLDDKGVYVRAGRQELLYGSQRLMTPLPWGNKRHAFDGVKVFRQGEKWDFDAYWAQFVPPKPGDLDHADADQNLAGAWLTYKPKKGETVDFYYLMFNNRNSATQQGIVRSPFTTHTFGTRWAGDNEGWLWDFEGALQSGRQASSDILAGMGTAGLGHTWKDACLTPTFWMYYDYASGDSSPNSGTANTFNQQFPFGHYYLGWIDLVGRQNIHDVNAHLYLYPAPWATVWLQYHHFWLAQSRDALYNAGGVAIRRDATGASGNNVGDEIDLVLNFHLTRYSDILVGYSKLFGGSYLQRTATGGPNRAVDSESLYFIFQQRF